MVSRLISYLKGNKEIFCLLLISGIVVSCANMASPSGGDFDFDPPKVVRSTPKFNATNVDGLKIQIFFDELVQIENPSEKVIVTPPQKKLPKIQAISNRVIVELRDTLIPNTTYTIDFTDAIVDNNEKNALENFSVSFSTGDIVDSLSISGKVLTADNLEPVKSIYVGLHSDLNDSAFIKKAFDRISRTNEKGEFTIKGIAEGKYRLYALNDVTRSYRYENPSDAMAFLDSIIIPVHTRASRLDTIFNKDLTIDTIMNIGYTRFLPDNIVLRSFVSSFQRQYLQKHERVGENELKIFFGSPTALPKLTPVNFDADKEWSILERSTVHNDSLKYWVIDPEIMQMDTIILRIDYNITDSLNNIIPAVDTLSFVNRTRRMPVKEKDNKKKKDKEETKFLDLRSNLKGTFNVFEPINIKFGEPITDFDESKFSLSQLIDSTYIDEKISIIKDSLDPMRYMIRHKWQSGASYRFVIDSAAFHSYTGLWNNKHEMSFKIRNIEEYGNLYINLRGLNQNEAAFVELLNGSDNPIRKSKVKDGGVLFMNLDPGKYYTRIIIDTNNNGVWDSGDYYKKRQPEEVYYYDKYFDVKANWNIEEDWDIRSVTLSRQKPLEITKNKPKEKDSKRKQLEQRDAKVRQQQQMRNENRNTTSSGDNEYR